MTIWIALFRGINVGGNNPLPMKELVPLLEELGCTDVRTYIQSGNVVFRSAMRSADTLALRIAKSVQAATGFAVRVLVLDAPSLARAAANNPFVAAQRQGSTLHLYFLAQDPANADLAALERLRAGNEAFALRERVFYLHTPDGAGSSKLAKNAERLIGVDATARNWNTVVKLREMAALDG